MNKEQEDLEKKYMDFQVEDLAADDFFLAYLQGEQKAKSFFSNWIQKFPPKKFLVEEAQELVNQLKDLDESSKYTASVDGQLDQLMNRINLDDQHPNYLSDEQKVIETEYQPRSNNFKKIAIGGLLLVGSLIIYLMLT